MGDWKLVSAREDRSVWELFDLAADRCEQRDLAAQHPDRARNMESRWNELEKQFRRCAGE
jgi:arylsulfatase